MLQQLSMPFCIKGSVSFMCENQNELRISVIRNDRKCNYICIFPSINSSRQDFKHKGPDRVYDLAASPPITWNILYETQRTHCQRNHHYSLWARSNITGRYFPMASLWRTHKAIDTEPMKYTHHMIQYSLGKTEHPIICTEFGFCFVLLW